jgi:hypothetical protein
VHIFCRWAAVVVQVSEQYIWSDTPCGLADRPLWSLIHTGGADVSSSWLRGTLLWQGRLPGVYNCLFLCTVSACGSAIHSLLGPLIYRSQVAPLAYSLLNIGLTGTCLCQPPPSLQQPINVGDINEFINIKVSSTCVWPYQQPADAVYCTLNSRPALLMHCAGHACALC